MTNPDTHAPEQDRAEPLTGDALSRAAAMRAAGDIIGPEKLAQGLGMSSRSIYWMMNGQRTVKDGVLADTRRLLIEHRQKTTKIIAAFRSIEGLE